MKLFYKFMLLLNLFFISINAHCSDTKTYVVESIEDGDTIVVNFKDKSQRIQLSGIDAPENTVNAKLNVDIKTKQIAKEHLLEIGNVATDFLKEQIIVGQKVELQGDLSQADNYGRIPAVVINEKGVSLNERMIEAGFAITLTRYPIDEDFKKNLQKAEKNARLKKRGLWKSHTALMNIWTN